MKKPQFYRSLATAGAKVRVGTEANGQAGWFERLLGELNFELRIGDAAKIRAKRVRKQKTDRQDAQHLLRLLRWTFHGFECRAWRIAIRGNSSRH